jgi:hypothetical protein
MRENYTRANSFEMGEYAANRGIRPYPYSTDFNLDPQIFSDMFEHEFDFPHEKGFMWCEILLKFIRK